MIYERIATPLVARAMLAALVATVVCKTVRWTGLLSSGAPRELVDFDAFYIAGQMAWRGDVTEAYHFETLMKAQRDLGGSSEFMPWTYPPPFDLVVAGLAILPIWLSYLLFTGLTLAGFVLILRRLSGPAFAAVVVTVFPVLATVIACGQNGFLTGSLIGLACLALLRDRAAAGLPLGLMVIKPHLALTFAFYVAVTRRWTCLLTAATVTAGFAGLATLVFGVSVWPAFLQGVREAGDFLVAGYYPLYRMVSVYASLRSFDLSPTVAMLVQAGSTVAALGLVAVAIRLGMPARQVLGLTALCGPMVGPYAYDYDLSLYAVALALLMPDLLRRTSDREQIALVALSWAVSGYGSATSMLVQLQVEGSSETASHAETVKILPPSVAGPILLLLIAFVWRVLRREAASVRGRAVPDHALSVAA